MVDYLFFIFFTNRFSGWYKAPQFRCHHNIAAVPLSRSIRLRPCVHIFLGDTLLSIRIDHFFAVLEGLQSFFVL